MGSLLKEEEIDIGTFTENKNHGATITHDFYDKDKQLTLRVNQNSYFILSFEIWWPDEGIYNYKLKKRDIEIIPEKLRDAMLEVMKSGEGSILKLK
jgi:hypothetical protein